MKPIRRRCFLSGAFAAVAASGLDARTWARAARDPNDQIRLALVGVGNRGRELLKHVLNRLELRYCELAAVCDVDRVKLDSAIKEARNGGQSPEGYSDLRRVYDRKDIDAVVIATPTHWHALATVWACQAGKDVFVEHPVSHDPNEGRSMQGDCAILGNLA